MVVTLDFEETQIKIPEQRIVIIGTDPSQVDINLDNSNLSPTNSLKDFGVSKKHIQLHQKGEDYMQVFVEDLKSTCGTYHNGEKLTPNQEYSLENRDNLAIGSSGLECTVLIHNPKEGLLKSTIFGAVNGIREIVNGKNQTTSTRRYLIDYQTGKTHSLDFTKQKIYVIGRNGNITTTTIDRYVSRSHLELFEDAKKTIARNLSKTGLTKIGDEVLKPEEERPLKEGVTTIYLSKAYKLEYIEIR